MQIVYLVLAMVVVGLLMGWVAGFIWRDRSSSDARSDYIASIITAIVIGLIDWFVIPAMGFSDNLRNLGVALEPALGALIVLWIIRKARS
jgi:uncharacterized membrane protein YeaQ/YmgE (transglycosylase-associated protein family)